MSKRRGHRISRRLVLSVLSVTGVIGVWILLTSGMKVIPFAFLPPPQYIVFDFWRLLRSTYVGNTLVGHTLVSLQIVMGGFLLAVGIGIPLGILMGWFKRIEAVVDPLF